MDTLETFYREYQPPITAAHYTCVGLAFELIHRLHSLIPQHHDAHDKFYVVSCEEVIETLTSYLGNVPPDKNTVEKEHVLVCLKIQLGSGDKRRRGYLLLDPGYHVSRVVTVMEDGLYPNTGKFVQSDDGMVKKEYEYKWKCDYVAWEVTHTKQGIKDTVTSLIFTGRPFLSAVDVAERRNLVYNFKSLLRRDPKGRVLAGIYFTVNPGDTKVTLFYMENNNKVSVKLQLVKNMRETKDVRECEEQLGLKKGKMMQTLTTVNKIIHDENFISQMLNLEEKINSISAEN